MIIFDTNKPWRLQACVQWPHRGGAQQWADQSPNLPRGLRISPSQRQTSHPVYRETVDGTLPTAAHSPIFHWPTASYSKQIDCLPQASSYLTHIPTFYLCLTCSNVPLSLSLWPRRLKVCRYGGVSGTEWVSDWRPLWTISERVPVCEGVSSLWPHDGFSLFKVTEKTVSFSVVW